MAVNLVVDTGIPTESDSLIDGYDALAELVNAGHVRRFRWSGSASDDVVYSLEHAKRKYDEVGWMDAYSAGVDEQTV